MWTFKNLRYVNWINSILKEYDVPTLKKKKDK